jgi:hypothetical protein
MSAVSPSVFPWSFQVVDDIRPFYNDSSLVTTVNEYAIDAD